MKEDEELHTTVDTDVEPPIDLRSIEEEQLLFYLSACAPLSVSEFASECKQTTLTVEQILTEEFEWVIQLDAERTIQLTDAARLPVARAGDEFIESAKELFEEGEALERQEECRRAADRFEKTVSVLRSVCGRFEAVHYEPKRVNQLLETAEERHDSVSKTAAKRSIDQCLQKADQHETVANERADTDTADAIEEYQYAHVSLLEALDEVQEYNHSRLRSDTEKLTGDSIEERVESLKRKLRELESREDEPDSRPAEEKSSSNTDPTESDLVRELVDLTEKLGKVPSAGEMQEQGTYDKHQYFSTFGSWKDAVEATEFDVRTDLLDDVRSVAEELGKRPTTGEIDEHGRYSASRYQRYFDTWEDVLDTAGVEQTTDEELLAEIQRLDEELDKLPLTSDMRDHGSYSANRYRDRFDSWDDALEKAGIDKQKRLVEELHRVTEKVDGRPTTTQMNEIGKYSSSLYANEFGSWGDALDVAGIEPISRRDLLDQIERVAEELGRPPNGDEIVTRGSYRLHRYTTEFGSWYEALDSADVDIEVALIDDLCAVDEKVDRTPTEADVDKFGNFQGDIYLEIFGSWKSSLDAAGIDNSSSDGRSPEQRPIETLQDEIDGIGRATVGRLKSAGYERVEDLRGVEKSELTTVEKVEPLTATRILEYLDSIGGRTATRASELAEKTEDVGTSSGSESAGNEIDDLTPSAFENSRETIPNYDRLDGQFLARIDGVKTPGNETVVRVFHASDRNEKPLTLKVWKTQDQDGSWTEDHWYALKNVRGQVWEDDTGETRKLVSSTKDFEVVPLGPDFDPSEAKDGIETPPTAREEKRDERHEKLNTTAEKESGKSFVSTKDSEPDSEEDGEGTILDDIISDFEEME